MPEIIKIREETEERERKSLHPNAALSSNSKGREREEEPCPIRTVYQRDRDRIIHSKSFRRLKHKTQVFLSPMGDHYRTRLTHTLEVAQIARTISKALRLNEDLTEAIALGHDLGHTPFGHSGEEVLNRILKDGFSHAEQSLRVVEKLEREGKGLNLTWEVRDGIINHSKGMRPIIELEKDKLPATLEGQVMRFADIIAYINHDTDDAIRAGLITEKSLPEAVSRDLGKSHSERIDTIVKDMISNSMDNGLKIIRISRDIIDRMEALRSFLTEKVYTYQHNLKETEKATRMVTTIFEYFIKHPSELGKYTTTISSDPLERRIADFIAGMTDRYAIQLFQRLYIPLSGITCYNSR